MNTLNKVYSKLNKKTELATHKVDLALADELKKRSQDLLKNLKAADGSWRDYQDYLTNADKPFKKMISNYDDLDGSIAFAQSSANKYLKAAKELGVNVKSNKDYQNVIANLKTAEEVIKTIASFKDPSTFQ